MSFTYFDKGNCFVGYKFFDMKVNPDIRKMVITNPHLIVYKTSADNEKDGGQKIMNYLMSTVIGKKQYDVEKVAVLPVEQYDFENVFKEFCKKQSLTPKQ